MNDRILWIPIAAGSSAGPPNMFAKIESSRSWTSAIAPRTRGFHRDRPPHVACLQPARQFVQLIAATRLAVAKARPSEYAG